MPSYPNRCQHIKINGTQCGSPALRRNRFCYFHKRHHDEQIELNTDRLKNDRKKIARRRATIDLPVLEDANSIQISLMQIMRLLISGQLDGKTAGLLLYALQTASSNLHRTTFEPDRHEVILDPNTVDETFLGEDIWEDSDFEEEENEEDSEDNDSSRDPAREAGIRKAAEYLYELDARSNRPVPAFAAKPEPAKATPTALQPTAADIRKQVTEQIIKAVPELLAANPELRAP
jgi:hypothetical protein